MDEYLKRLTDMNSRDKFLYHLKESIRSFGIWGGVKYHLLFLIHRTFDNERGTNTNKLAKLNYIRGGGKIIILF